MADARQHLRADCSRCTGLCCVAPAFAASADFAIDKPAGQPCPHLGADAACAIHRDLRGRGFAGCAVFDCFGAGQHLTQVTLGGRSWRDGPGTAAQALAAFPVVRQLHEVLWHLAEAIALAPDGPLHDELDRVRRDTERLTLLPPDALAAVDGGAVRREVGPLLERVSEQVRAPVRRGRDRRGADLVGASLRGADLRRTSLRGALLLGADLRGADLTRADLLGADLRGADVRGARLHGALFLTQPQVEAARGDGATTLPHVLARPGHWAA